MIYLFFVLFVVYAQTKKIDKCSQTANTLRERVRAVTIIEQVYEENLLEKHFWQVHTLYITRACDSSDFSCFTIHTQAHMCVYSSLSQITYIYSVYTKQS